MKAFNSSPPLAIISRAFASIARKSCDTIVRLKPSLFIARVTASATASIGVLRRIAFAFDVRASEIKGSKYTAPAVAAG